VIAVAWTAAFLAGVGATLLLDAWWRRSDRPDLAERLLPYQPESVSDEAECWLDQQG
jgi:hypothetical protein